MITRRTFLGGLLATAAARPQNPRRPNVIVILADDLGFGETSCFGSTDIQTPHIDSLARHGIQFTQGYVSCPVCSPTRAGLLTGRYQQRFGHEFNPGPARAASGDFGLPLREKTMADQLRAAGYATGLVGKWHLGYRPEYHPQKRGFDFFFGFLGGAHSYEDAQADPDNPILRGTETVARDDYLTQAFAREATGFIERNRQRPFFLYLALNAVHGPMQATEQSKARFRHIRDDRRRTFAGMVGAMDDAVGAVLSKLRAENLEDNTLIFFLSDNGGPTRQTTSGNGPLRGYKGQVYEGGIRVPFLAQWKGRLEAGKTYEHPVIALDILPTAVAAAGAVVPSDLDGVNLLPYLTGARRDAPHEALYWRFGDQSAVRKGDWKLARVASEPAQLFHLGRDIGETNDLAARERDKLRELQAAYDAWNQQLMAPLWGRPNRGRGKKGGQRKR